MAVASGNAVPPTPLTSFIRGAQNLSTNSSFVGLILAGYRDHFVDGSYHTRLDVMDEPEIMHANIIRASKLVLAGMLSLSGASTTAVSINQDFAESLITCLYSNWTCSYFQV